MLVELHKFEAWMSSFLFVLLISPSNTSLSRIISTRQGLVRGYVSVLKHPRLPDVEAFIGLPYAAPPIGYKRFMPPSNPESRPPNSIYDATQFKPVCPQLLPNLSDEMRALRYMSLGRFEYLKVLTPYLQNQSEDCLYLNIYKPKRDGARFQTESLPVVVFIHGESYEWNSGNPYDGSVFASYGDVILVTINFRLGIFGFLKPTLGEHVISNFGILDIIAGLQWIKENIRTFNGDPNSVTLIGHGTGGSLISFLILSPVAQASNDLFHRVIMMSGSFLSSMALTHKPSDLTLQVASQLRCPLDSEPLMNCLRNKPVKELLHVKINVPMYTTPFGPNVDGIVIEDSPEKLLRQEKYLNILSRLDIMFGLTSSEAFHQFPAPTVTYGVTSEYLETILRSFLLSTYKQNSDTILNSILNEYTDYRIPQENNITNRNNMFKIFSDAKVAAPLLKMAEIHSEVSTHRSNSYFYVFEHQTTHGYYSQVFGSIHGEEIAYGFGMPLSGGMHHLVHNYTVEESVLSEIMMNYWINFIYAGNVNEFSIRSQKLLSTNEKLDTLAPSWPNFDSMTQQYMSFDLEVNVKSHYRAHELSLWNDFIPKLVEPFEEEDAYYKENDHVRENPTLSLPPPKFPSDSSQNLPSVIVTARPTYIPRTTSRPSVVTTSGIPISIVILVGFVFLTFNTCACIALAYQRRRIREREDSLQKTLSRLSINSEMTAKSQTDSLKSAMKKDTSYSNYHRRPSRVLFEDEIYEDRSSIKGVGPENKLNRLRKSLPDIPAVVAGAIARARGEPDRPPSPIIEMVPISTYETMYSRHHQDPGLIYGITFPNYGNHSPYPDELNEICVCPLSETTYTPTYVPDDLQSNYARVQLPVEKLITPSQDLYVPVNCSQPNVVASPDDNPLPPPEKPSSSSSLTIAPLPLQVPSANPVLDRKVTPVLRKIGEKTPPGTLKRDALRRQESCKSWCSTYNQSFLSKTIETPQINLEPLADEETSERSESSQMKGYTEEGSENSNKKEEKVVAEEKGDQVKRKKEHN
ncbi:neuroligin-1 [Lepeophtheirus salmonis]|uniref:neuroligin-1 n=1 Tax=Lepeophtheirus salmonis TaxID=72036 RepID=UPI001AE3658C|nr:neuroligin-4, X-linked-like [Lepeophtheirus salmonis]